MVFGQRGVFRHDLAIPPKVERAPVRILLHARLISGRPRRIALDVGPERRRVLQDLQHFGANVGSRRLDFVEARKIIPVVKLDLRQFRKVIDPGLLEKNAAFPEHDVERLPETIGGSTLEEALRNQPVDQRALEFLGVALAHGLGAG